MIKKSYTYNFGYQFVCQSIRPTSIFFSNFDLTPQTSNYIQDVKSDNNKLKNWGQINHIFLGLLLGPSTIANE